MYRYSDTLGFDLAVVVFVVGVMPLAVFLMQSKRRLARATALALMFAAVMYVAVFEHYRLHRPEVTELGLKRAVVPESVLDFVEARLEERQRASRERRFLENQLVFAEIATLPVAADEDILRAACAEMAASPTRKVEPEPAVFPFGRSVPRKAGTSGNKKAQKNKRPVDAGPLMVHLSHRGAGDRLFADALSALERETCGDARDETGGGDIPENEEEEYIPENADDEFAAARAPASPPEVSFANVSAFALRRSRPRCAPRRVVASEPGNGPPGALSFETLFDESSAVGDRNVFVTFESPARADASLGNLLRAAETAGVTYSYRAVFFVRDPRDVVTQAYLDRIARRSTLDVEHRSDFDSDFDGPGHTPDRWGIDREIDAFTAAVARRPNDERLAGFAGTRLGNKRSRSGIFRSFLDAAASRNDTDTFVSLSREENENDSEENEDSAFAFASSLRLFATLASKNKNVSLRFVRFEDMLVASRAGFELLGRWFGLRDGADVDAFADACVDAQARFAETKKASVPPGAWRSHFTPRDVARFDRAHGALLRSLGYQEAGTSAGDFGEESEEMEEMEESSV